MFSTVCDQLPGELAPKLALGFAAEAAGDLAAARRYYQGGVGEHGQRHQAENLVSPRA